MSLVHNTLTPDIETASDDYHARFTGAVGKFFLEVQEHRIIAMLARIGAGPFRILEVGGGHGQITEALVKGGHSVQVQGSSETCFRRLEKLRGQYPERLGFTQSDLWRIPFQDREFDVVIALRLLAHVEKWRELLGEMARLSKRAVIFDFASVSALNALSPLLFSVKRKIEGNTRPYFSYRSSKIRAVMEELGFERTDERRQFFFPMGLHRLIGSPRISLAAESAARSLGFSDRLGSPAITLYIRSPKSLTP